MMTWDNEVYRLAVNFSLLSFSYHSNQEMPGLINYFNMLIVDVWEGKIKVHFFFLTNIYGDFNTQILKISYLAFREILRWYVIYTAIFGLL